MEQVDTQAANHVVKKPRVFLIELQRQTRLERLAQRHQLECQRFVPYWVEGLRLAAAAHDLPALNSFFQRAGRRGPQTESLRRWIAAQALTGPPVVLVTHQVNITALTDRYAGSGEMVVVKRLPGGGLQVVGTLETE